MVSDLNKNIGGSMDLAKKKARTGKFAYPRVRTGPGKPGKS